MAQDAKASGQVSVPCPASRTIEPQACVFGAALDSQCRRSQLQSVGELNGRGREKKTPAPPVERSVVTDLPRHLPALAGELLIWRAFLADEIRAILNGEGETDE